MDVGRSGGVDGLTRKGIRGGELAGGNNNPTSNLMLKGGHSLSRSPPRSPLFALLRELFGLIRDSFPFLICDFH